MVTFDPCRRIGTTGWSIPKHSAAAFPAVGSHLQRYAAIFSAVEISSSFYRSHRPATYVRWAASVPQGFRFSVKVPRVVSHERRLVDAAEPLARFLDEVAALGPALGPLLVQLPPSLRYDEAIANRFFECLRKRSSAEVACEPRHASWFTESAETSLSAFHVARVAADPAAAAQRAAEPGGWGGFVYIRLHGSPEMYRSAYPLKALEPTLRRLRSARADGKSCWCVFDNTVLGAATTNALDVLRRL